MANKNLVRLGGAYVEITGDNGKLLDALKDSEDKVQSFSREFAKAGAAFSAIGVGVSAPMKKAVDSFAEFEKQMLITQNVTKASSYQLERLTRQAKQLGATTSWTTSEVAQGMLALGRMGFKNNEIEKTISSVMDLGRALDVDVAKASKELGAVMRQFGADASEAVHYADALATATNSAAIEMSELLESMKYVGAAGNAIGADVETVLALTMALRNSGVSASQAGTQLRSMFLKFQNPKDVALFADKFGVDIYNAEGRLKSFLDIMVEAQGRARTMGDSLAVVARRMFGTLQAPAFITLLKSRDLEEYRKRLYDCDGAAEDFRKSMESGVYGSLKLAESAVEAVGLQLGETLAPSVDSTRQLIQDLSENFRAFIQNNAPFINMIAETGVAFTALGGAILAGTGIVKGFSGAWSLSVGAFQKVQEAWRKAGVEVGVLNTEVETLNAEMAKLDATAPGAELAAPFEAIVTAAQSATASVRGLNAELSGGASPYSLRNKSKTPFRREFNVNGLYLAENQYQGAFSTYKKPYFRKRTNLDGLSLDVPDLIEPMWNATRRQAFTSRSNQLSQEAINVRTKFDDSVAAARNKRRQLDIEEARENAKRDQTRREAGELRDKRLAESAAKRDQAIREAGEARDRRRAANAEAYQTRQAELKWTVEGAKNNARERLQGIRDRNAEHHQIIGDWYSGYVSEAHARHRQKTSALLDEFGNIDATRSKRFKVATRDLKVSGGVNIDSLRDVSKRRPRADSATIEGIYDEFQRRTGGLAQAEQALEDARKKRSKFVYDELKGWDEVDKQYVDGLVRLHDREEDELRRARAIKDASKRDEVTKLIKERYHSYRSKMSDAYIGRGGVDYSGVKGGAGTEFAGQTDRVVEDQTKFLALQEQEKLNSQRAEEIARRFAESTAAERAAVEELIVNHADDVEWLNKELSKTLGWTLEVEKNPKVAKAYEKLNAAVQRRDNLIKSRDAKIAQQASTNQDEIAPLQKQYDELMTEYGKTKGGKRKDEILEEAGTIKLKIGELEQGAGDIMTRFSRDLEDVEREVLRAQQELELAKSEVYNFVANKRRVALSVGAGIDDIKVDELSSINSRMSDADAELVEDVATARVGRKVLGLKADEEAYSLANDLADQIQVEATDLNSRVREGKENSKREYDQKNAEADADFKKKTASIDDDYKMTNAAITGDYSVTMRTLAEDEATSREDYRNRRARADQKMKYEILQAGDEAVEQLNVIGDKRKKLESDYGKGVPLKVSDDFTLTNYDSFGVAGNAPSKEKGVVVGPGSAEGSFVSTTNLSHSTANVTPQMGVVTRTNGKIDTSGFTAMSDSVIKVGKIASDASGMIGVLSDQYDNISLKATGATDSTIKFNDSVAATAGQVTTTANEISIAANETHKFTDQTKLATVNGEAYQIVAKEEAVATQNIGESAKRSAVGLQALKFAANMALGALKLLGGMVVSMVAWTAVMTIFQKIADYAHKTAEDMRKAGEIAADVADKDQETADRAYEQTDSDVDKIDAFIERAGSKESLNEVEKKRLDKQFEYLKEKGILTDAEVVEDPDSPSGYRILNAGAANAMKARALGLQIGELEKSASNERVSLYGFGLNKYKDKSFTVDEAKKEIEGLRAGRDLIESLNDDQREALFGGKKGWFGGKKTLYNTTNKTAGTNFEEVNERIKKLYELGDFTEEQEGQLRAFMDIIRPFATGETPDYGLLKLLSSDNGAAFVSLFDKIDSLGASSAAAEKLKEEQAAYQAEADKEKDNPYESQYDKQKREAELEEKAQGRAASFDTMRKTLDEMTLNRQEDNLTASEKQIAALKRQWEEFVKGAGNNLTEQERKNIAEMKKLTDDQIKYLQGKALEEHKQETNDKLEEQFGKVVNDLKKVDYKEKKITRSDDEGRTFYTKTVKELDYDDANKDWEKLTAAIDYYKKHNVDLSSFYQTTAQGVKDMLNSTKTMISTTTTLNTYEAMQMSQDVALDTERQQLEQMRRLNDNARKIYDWMTNQDEFKEYL